VLQLNNFAIQKGNSYHNRKSNIDNSISLNEEQAEGVYKIKEFLKNDEPLFTLTGPAGSGKTFMLNHALRGVRKSIWGSTISHSAKNILENSLGNVARYFFTMAQLIGAKPSYDQEEVKFILTGKPKLNDTVDILVIDEASMIDDNQFKMVMDRVIRYGIKLIAVGDVFQLPPVGQSYDSKFFNQIDHSLLKSMRFNEEIGFITDKVRNTIANIACDEPFNRFVIDDDWIDHKSNYGSDNNGYRYENNIYKLIDEIAQDIYDHKDNPNHVRALAYHRNVVKLLNTEIRKKIYSDKDMHNQFNIDEIVISEGGFGSEVRNGEVHFVKGVRHGIGPLGIPCVFLKLDTHTSYSIPVVSSDEHAQSKYKSQLEYFRKRALRTNKWDEYHKFVNSFAVFEYGYSTTMHKAQGMTLEKVFVLEGDIMSSKKTTLKEKFQALYVAMTRPRKELVIYNKKRK
jgi:exodeoxyribonuclease-5